MPRIAQIKLAGGLNSDDVKVTGKSLQLALMGALMFLGAGVAGASFLGASLFDVREAAARTGDGAMADVGFAIGDVEVVAMEGAPELSEARVAEVLAVVRPEHRRSILGFDPFSVQQRVQGLDWVASVRVRRLWPSQLLVEVERREEFALWREDGEVSVIDANGERLLAERAADHPDLPIFIGEGAGPAAPSLLVALENAPEVRARVASISRVGGRRWDLELENGTLVALPEQAPERALDQLERLQARYALLDRPVASLDLRIPGRLAVNADAALAGGALAMAGGA
jgi:cell division protein FtsQ